MFKPNFKFTSQITKSLMQIESSRQAISDLPISIEILRQLRETALLTSTHFSTQIEGNRLTLPEVKAVLRGEKFPDRQRDELEVRNHYRAFQYMEQIATQNKGITEAEIKTIHGFVFYGKGKPTAYRTQQNVIRESASGGIVYLPPEANDVSKLMQELVTWINTEIEDGNIPVPVIAGLAHYQFATIHPYIDGNGRTARLLTTLILKRYGYGLKGIYSLDEHYAKNLRAYYDSLSIGNHNYYEGRVESDITSFVTYFIEGMAESFSKIKTVASRENTFKIDQADIIKKLDLRERRLLELLNKEDIVTSEQIAKHLKLTKRSVLPLCVKWIEKGLLEYADASRKLRSYRAGQLLKEKN